MLRSIRTSVATLRVLVLGLAAPLAAQQGPCEQVTAACTNAGFVGGGASTGTGLQKDCVFPIMQGIAQPATATRPLPRIDPAVVAACKVRRPDFGQGKGPPPAALGVQMPANASPLATQPPPPAALGAQLPPSASPLATQPPPPSQLPTGAATVTHLPDESPAALTAPAPGKGLFAVEMETSFGGKTPLGNASTATVNQQTRTVSVYFAKGDQELNALKSCFAGHCLFTRVIITKTRTSGGESTPVVVYTLSHGSVRDLAYTACPGPLSDKPCVSPLVATFGYEQVDIQYPPNPAH
jgi:hypothetical protein